MSRVWSARTSRFSADLPLPERMDSLNWILHFLGLSPLTLQEVTLFLRRYGYGILFLGTLLEGEAVVLVAGVLAHAGVLDLGGVILSAWAGSTLNDQALYQLGYRYGEKVLGWLPRIFARHAARAEGFIRRFGDGITVVFRFLYGTRTVTPILLGIHRYPLRRYWWLNILAALVWSAAVAVAGYLLGASIPLMLGELHHLQMALLGAVALAVLFFWWRSRPPS